MQANLPFSAGILKIIKFNLELDSGVVHERTSTDYELDFYISGTRTMTINGQSFSTRAGSVVFRRPGDHTLAGGSYNCYAMTLDFSGEKEALYGRYDRNDPSNAMQKRSNDPLLALIPSHFIARDPSEYIKIYDQLCYHSQNVNAREINRVLLNRLFFLALSDICHAMYRDAENGRESRVLTETCKYVQSNFHRSISIEELAENVSFSPSYFYKLFKRMANTTPAEYIISVRLSNAKHLLLESDLTVAEIAEMCGFCGASYFSYDFKRRVGMTPVEYRRKKEISD